MAKKKSKQKQQAKQGKQNTQLTPNKSLLRDNEVLKKVFSSLFYFAGSIVAVYELINYFRSDTKTFTSLIIPSLIGIVWLVVLVQMFRRGNSYAYVLLAITVVGGVVGGIGWQSYNRTQEDKVIVLVAKFDGPETTYGVRDQLIEQLKLATKEYDDIEIIAADEVITSAKGTDQARKLGNEYHADIVIWAWYRVTNNPNVTIHVENMTPNDFFLIDKSEVYLPQATRADLESFALQKRIGAEASNLVLFLKGYFRIKSNDCTTAINLFESILNTEAAAPFISQEDVFFLIGACWDYLGQPERAIENYDQAIEIKQDFIQALGNRAIDYYNIGDSKRAIRELERLATIKPTDAGVYNNLGYIYNNLGQYEQAMQELDRAIEIDPNGANLYNSRGGIKINLSQYASAKTDFDKAIQLEPEIALFYNNRAVAYTGLNQVNVAMKDHGKAIDLAPDNPYYYISRGLSYEKLGNTRKAMKDFNKAIQVDPSNAIAYSSRASLYFSIGDYDGSIKDFDKAIEIDPKDWKSYFKRGNTFFVLKQYDRAVSDYSEAIKIKPEESNLFFVRGMAYYEKGTYLAAIQDYSQVIQISPDIADAYSNRGEAYQRLGRMVEADADFKKYEELTGKKP